MSVLFATQTLKRIGPNSAESVLHLSGRVNSNETERKCAETDQIWVGKSDETDWK